MRSSVYDLLCADRFDVAFASGVINPPKIRSAFLQRMARVVTPGSQVLNRVYGCDGNRWLVAPLGPLLRARFSSGGAASFRPSGLRLTGR